MRDYFFYRPLSRAIAAGDLTKVNFVLKAQKFCDNIIGRVLNLFGVTNIFAVKPLMVGDRKYEYYERPVQIAAYHGRVAVLQRLLELPEVIEMLKSPIQSYKALVHAGANAATLRILLHTPGIVSRLAQIDAMSPFNQYVTIFFYVLRKGGGSAAVNCVLEIPVFLENLVAEQEAVLFSFANAYRDGVRARVRREQTLISGEDAPFYEEDDTWLSPSMAEECLLILNSLLAIPGMLSSIRAMDAALTGAMMGDNVIMMNRLLEVPAVFKKFTTDKDFARSILYCQDGKPRHCSEAIKERLERLLSTEHMLKQEPPLILSARESSASIDSGEFLGNIIENNDVSPAQGSQLVM